jgi:predicted metal-dependent TIM-barrel fold hydrolase
MRATGRMHSARLENSPRLQRVLSLLRVRGSQGATTREIVEHANVCAVNSVISELRTAGVTIQCRMEARSAGGASIYRYWLAPPIVPTQGDLFH